MVILKIENYEYVVFLFSFRLNKLHIQISIFIVSYGVNKAYAHTARYARWDFFTTPKYLSSITP